MTKKRPPKELVVKAVDADGSLDLMTPKESRAWRRKLKTRIHEKLVPLVPTQEEK